MKRKLLYVATFATGMLLTACSNDDLNLAGDGLASHFDQEGNAWVKIGISLPTANAKNYAPKKRAIGEYGNDYGQFNDGEKYEYAVENAILVLFTGTGDDEATYTFQSAYQLSSGEWNMDGSTQITNNRTFVQQINNAGATGALYAYVILNKHNFFEVNGSDLRFTSGQGDHANYSLKKQKNDAAEADPVNPITFANFQKLAINESGRRYDQNCFLMTNMPYASQPGGASAPDPATIVMKSLYPVDVTAIYESRTEAELGTAATEVNVERVLAKVETSWAYTTSGNVVRSDDPLTSENEAVTADGNHFYTEDGNAYQAQILGWFIDNTNKTNYVARNFVDPDGGLNYLAYQSERTNVNNDSPWLYTTKSHRFISGAAVTDGAYRTFWAIDPNYNDKPAASGRKDDPAVVAAENALINEGGEFVNNTLMNYNAAGVNVGGRLRANGSAYYCTENTFDVAHQSHFNTTRVVVAAQFNGGNGFYTIAQEAGKMYTTEAITTYTKARIAERVHFMQWVEDYYAGTDATELIDVTLNNHGGVAGAAEVTISNVPDGLTDADIKPGKLLADAKTAWKNNVDDLTTGDNVFLANNFHISYYKDGVAYYSALIKHFGDYETPWFASWYAGQENTVSGVYDALDGTDFDAQSYLGRYGIVRNNWYKIEVEGIRQIGSAVVPVLPGYTDPTNPDTPDDQVENFLKVKINITPWAIRKQSTKL